MRCFILLTLVGGLSNVPDAVKAPDEVKSAVNRDLIFTVIPIKPDPKTEYAKARTSITTTRGVFYVVESRDQVLAAKCYAPPGSAGVDGAKSLD